MGVIGDRGDDITLPLQQKNKRFRGTSTLAEVVDSHSRRIQTHLRPNDLMLEAEKGMDQDLGPMLRRGQSCPLIHSLTHD